MRDLTTSKKHEAYDIVQIIEERSCLICRTRPVDWHHVKSKRSGGDDSDSNLIPLCREHHQEFHFTGIVRFADKHESFMSWMRLNGWKWCKLKQSWKRFMERP